MYESSGGSGQAPGYEGGTESSPGGFGSTGSDGFIRTHWSDSPERVADYADRLGTYNQDNIDYLRQQGERSSYEMGKYLNAFARTIPKAPDTSNGYDDVLGFLSRANRLLYGDDDE
jgi:hypothetical protein